MDNPLVLIFCCIFPLVWLFLPVINDANKKYARTSSKKRRGNSGSRSNPFQTIYIYRLKDGRKSFYVGQTVNPDARLSQHKQDMWGNTKKQNKIYSMYQRGRSPKMEIIKTTNSKAKADKIERQYIHWEGTHNTQHR